MGSHSGKEDDSKTSKSTGDTKDPIKHGTGK
jgi:hypothetical protein